MYPICKILVFMQQNLVYIGYKNLLYIRIDAGVWKIGSSHNQKLHLLRRRCITKLKKFSSGGGVFLEGTSRILVVGSNPSIAALLVMAIMSTMMIGGTIRHN